MIKFLKKLFKRKHEHEWSYSGVSNTIEKSQIYFRQARLCRGCNTYETMDSRIEGEKWIGAN